MQVRYVLGVCAAVLVLPASASAQQLIVNGGFESGDLTGWQAYTEDGSITDGVYPDASEMYSVGGGANPSPYSGYGTPGPSAGSYYALSDQNDPSAGVLVQTFTVPYAVGSATLSFDMFVQDQNLQGPCDVTNAGAIEYNTACSQFSLVDLWAGDLTVGDPFAAGIAADHYLEYTGFNEPAFGQWQTYTYDLSGFLAPGTYTLRFATVDNQSYYQQGIDNVSLEVTPAAVPEPSTVSLLALGLPLLGAGTMRRRRRRTA